MAMNAPASTDSANIVAVSRPACVTPTCSAFSAISGGGSASSPMRVSCSAAMPPHLSAQGGENLRPVLHCSAQWCWSSLAEAADRAALHRVQPLLELVARERHSTLLQLVEDMLE